MQATTMYRASDGRLFDTQADAAAWEAELQIAALYLAAFPGQVAPAARFAAAVTKIADSLTPLLQQLAAAKTEAPH
ncbi:MAG TPA: hypothetical protein VHW66_18960 [Stellaceae bacterium]|jgi:hypothetical protein|nr:hypothetical protein [Stellaceae bacterium]